MPTEITLEWVRAILPQRSHDAHKGTFGHVVIIAGSRGFTGAAKLACRAAARSGVGLVTALIPSAVAECVASGLMEPMWHPLPSTPEGTIAHAAVEQALAFLDGKQALVIGPGLSQLSETRRFVREVLAACSLPVLIDADGLNNMTPHLLSAMKRPPVITPHPGEMARLLGVSTDHVQSHREETAVSFAKTHRVTVVLKGYHTLVASPDGSVFVNPTGNPGMASGGTGDVLAGLMGGFLAQGMSTVNAATAGVFLHGLAGDLAAEDLTQRAMLASDMIDRLPQVFKRVEG